MRRVALGHDRHEYWIATNIGVEIAIDG